MNSSPTTELSLFASDVLAGLSAAPKHLSSKYFYDDEGSRLFQEIMKLPEYYLTRSELEIFQTQYDEIYKAFANGGKPGRNANLKKRASGRMNDERGTLNEEMDTGIHKSSFGIHTSNGAVASPPVNNAFDLIELGAGDGSKTAVLVSHFLDRGADITYSPIDISQEALDVLSKKFTREFPALKMETRKGDYFKILESLKNGGGQRKVLLFLGSNIGNFTREQSVEFFRSLRAVMNDDDLLFIGFDLQKDPHVIVRAYDDSAGVTAEFNLNLLRRMNRELGADFDLSKWSHYAIYRPVECAARSFLISREKQSVFIKALNRSFEFEQWEAVFMEISQKYSLRLIEELAAASGFEIKHNFFDGKNYYCDSLWKIRA
jgi:dimethylhistidine N-methyltransferase